MKTTPRILVVGDNILDRWTEGATHRVSPEAPVVVISSPTRREGPGGAAAVAWIAAGFGASVTLLTADAADAAGDSLGRMLADAGIQVMGPRVKKCTVKERFLAESQGHQPHHVLRVDDDAPPLSEYDESQFLGLLETAISQGNFDVLLLADYGRLLTDSMVHKLLVWAELAGLPVLVDPSRGRSVATYGRATLIKMNRKEAERFWEFNRGDRRELLSSAQRFANTFATTVVITLDRDGASLLTPGADAPTLRESLADSVVDVTGAGDSMLAAMGYLYATDREALTGGDLLDVAMRAAAYQVRHFGIVRVPRSVLDGGYLPPPNSPKIIRMDDEHDRAEFWARVPVGTPVALVPGCFDLLHAGHVYLFECARGLGGVVVVAVNSDDSVRRIKGQGRPICDQRARAGLVAGLASVDYVIVFGEDTPRDLIERMAPVGGLTVVKGNDHLGDMSDVPPGNTLLNVSRLRDLSTTNIVVRSAAVASPESSY